MSKFAFTLGSFLWALAAANAQFQSEWTQIHDPLAGGIASGLATDAEGNAYVLANYPGKFAVVKYSSDGAALWTKQYDSPLQDSANRLLVAPNNSILIAGFAATNGLPSIPIILNHASDGSFLWVHAGDVPNAQGPPIVAMDSVSNVWAATPTTSGYTFMKYDLDGTRRWTNSYPVPTGFVAQSFQTDSNGNAALLATRSAAGQDQMLVLRCSAAGTLTGTITAWPGASDFLTAGTFDAGGNLCVAASVMAGNPLRYHLFVAKYDRAGVLLWSNLRPPANGYHAVSRQLALDSAGNVIVTAYERLPLDEDEDELQTLTLKYSPEGEQLWAARANSFERKPNGLAIDGNDNIHVVGDDYYPGAAAFLLKYRPNGNQAAEALIRGIYSPGLIATSPNGGVCVSLGSAVETRKFTHLDGPSAVDAIVIPKLAEALPGSDITFTATVSGPGPFTYDWRYFGYQRGTNATLTITNVQYGGQAGHIGHGDYYVIVSNATSYTISPEAQLTVLRVPTVAMLPTRQFATIGDAFAMTANASGTEPLHFSWRKNNVLIPGFFSNVLNIATVQATDAGDYSVIVTNRAGSATSSVARLNVTLPPRSFTNATPIQISSNTLAQPYPSDLLVSGVTGQVLKVTATLRNFMFNSPDALAVLLQSPNNSGVTLMSDAVSDSAATNVTLTFDDDAPSLLPDEHLSSGTFRPTAWDIPTFAPPASPSPITATLSGVLPQNPNGVWHLFVMNEYPFTPAGQIAGGWFLNFLVQDPNAVISTFFRGILRTNDQILISWAGAPGWKLQRSPSLVAPAWTDVPGSTGQSSAQLQIGTGSEFFRLLKP